MKFTSVVVVLALAFCASASVLPIAPYGLNPWAYSSLGLSPLGLSPYAAPLLVRPQAISLAQGLAAPAVLAAPRVIAPYAAPHVIAPYAAPIALAAAEGSYVAATRGSVHTAPLPGHLESVSSTNLEPAPGTL